MVSKWTVAKTFKDVYCAIACKLGPKYPQITQIKDATVEKAPEFEAKYDMHQTSGCIDGTHVTIIWPAEYAQNYFCYKQFFSFSVHTVFGFRDLFMNVDCR